MDDLSESRFIAISMQNKFVFLLDKCILNGADCGEQPGSVCVLV